jgi:hypothetical protein
MALKIGADFPTAARITLPDIMVDTTKLYNKVHNKS